MRPKYLKFTKEAKTLIAEGADVINKAVSITLGPVGRNVVIDAENSLPQITKDGVTVVNAIFLRDEYKNVGCKLIKDVANRTVIDTGDGTTTATILTSTLLNSINTLEGKHKSVFIKRGVEFATKKALEFLKQKVRTIESNEDLIKIATISSNNDQEIGKLIADSYNQVTKDGIVDTEISPNEKTFSSNTSGFKISNGYKSQHFITNVAKSECVYEKCYILLTNLKIQTLKEIGHIVEYTMRENLPLLIIAEETDNEPLRSLVLNKQNNGVKVCVIDTPKFGFDRKTALEDLAVFTGATLIDKDNDMTMRESLPTYLGAAEKVIVKRNSTFIIGGKSDTKKLEDLISSVNTQIGEATDSEIKKRLKERLARLKGGASTIYIGGNSASEINQKKDRIDDAIAATRASLEEGFIVGGGVGYLKAAKYLRETDFSSYVEENFKSQTEDFNLGIKLLIDALEKPFKILCQNSEIEPDVLIQNIVDNKQDFNYGYNFLKDEYCDLYETGVIDPYKVTRCALENSVSVFNLILTTDCLVVDDNDDLI